MTNALSDYRKREFANSILQRLGRFCFAWLAAR